MSAEQHPMYLTRNGRRGPFNIEGVCVRCGKKHRGTAVLLELDQRIGEYHDLGGVPEAESQGYFEFGLDCAEALRSRAVPKLAALGGGR